MMESTSQSGDRTVDVTDVSVIICAFTDLRWDPMVEAIEGCLNQDQPAREVIVVIDNNPGLLQRTRERFPDLAVFANPGPQGLSYARNAGMGAARGSVIAFLDDDAIPARDWLRLVTDCLREPGVLGAGARVLPRWDVSPPAWFPEEFLWTIGCSHRGLPMTREVVRNPSGGAMCVLRSVFETVGGFRTDIGRVGDIPLGCEETELCISATQRMGGRFLFEPRAVVHHVVTARRATWDYFRRRCYAEGLSKAVVAAYVGSGDGLLAERRHVMSALPRGVARGLRDAVMGDLSGLGRAGAIVAGLAVTIAGYVRGKWSMARRVRRETERSAPRIDAPDGAAVALPLAGRPHVGR
jgi:glucosyl-dolichyl phosphate glucuronosyltransferase